MALNYARLQQVAVKLIADNGRLVTFFRQSKTPANPSQPWRGSGANNDVDTIPDVSAVVIPNDEIDDKEAMRRGDATAFVAASTFVLGQTPEDMVGIDRMVDGDGYTWHVHGVKLINPGGVRILYECVLEH